LASGEPGVESDTLKIKVGDGSRVWNQLPYVGDSGLAGTFVTSVNAKTGAVQLLPADLPGLAGFIKTVVSQTIAPGANVGISELTADGKLTISASGSGTGTGGGTVTSIGVTSLNGKAGVLSLIGKNGVTVDATAPAGEIDIGVTSGGTWTGDPLLPSVPSDVGGRPGNGLVNLSWTSSSGTPAATSYTVQYSSNSGGSWTTYGDTTGSTSALMVSGLANGTDYVFRVRAVAASGVSGWSAASPPLAPQTPDVDPVEITLSAKSIKENNAIGAVIGTLNAINPDASATHTFAITGGANAANFSITGNVLKAAAVLAVSTGVSRVVTITATSSSSRTLSQTFTITVVSVAAVPGTPTGLSASLGAVDSAGATALVSWTAPADNGAAITSYLVQLKRTTETEWSEGPAVETDTTCVLDLLDSATTYNVRVSAINSVGGGAFASTTVTTGKAIITFTRQPKNITSSDGTASFTAEATSSGPGDISYQWQRLSALGAWADLASETTTTLSLSTVGYQDDGARFRLRATSPDANATVSDTAVLAVLLPLWRKTDSSEAGGLNWAASDGTNVVAFSLGGANRPLPYTTNDGAVFQDGQGSINGFDSLTNIYVVGAASKGFMIRVVGNNSPVRQYVVDYVALYWSADGLTWLATNTQHPMQAGIAASTAGFYGWTSGDAMNPSYAYRSTDGLTWTPAPVPSPLGITMRYVRIVGAGSNLVAWSPNPNPAGTAGLWVSANAGLTWTAKTLPPKVTGKLWTASAYAGGKFFLFTVGNQYAVTSNFTSWQTKALPFTDTFSMAAASPDGKVIAVVGDRAAAAVCTDTTAETWALETMPIAGSGLSAIAASSSTMICIGGMQCCVRTLSQTNTVTSYNCVSGACMPISGTGGTYATLLACKTACANLTKSYNCVNGVCTEVAGTSGTYKNLTLCQLACAVSTKSYNCVSGKCTEVVGSGGTYATLLACQVACETAANTYDCIEGTCTEVIGPGGGYTTLADCKADCSQPPPPSNPTSDYRILFATWRHETVGKPPCFNKALGSWDVTGLSLSACRVSWPAGSVSYSRYQVDYKRGAAWEPLAIANSDTAGFKLYTAGTLKGQCYPAATTPGVQPYSLRPVSDNSFDIYNLERILKKGLAARVFKLLPDTPAARSELAAASIALNAANAVQVSSLSASFTTQLYAQFRITFYLSTGDTYVEYITLPAVDLDPVTGTTPVVEPGAPAGLTTPVWTREVNAAACWDVATVSWTAPATPSGEVRVEYLIPGSAAHTINAPTGAWRAPATADRWAPLPVSAAPCLPGQHPSTIVPSICVSPQTWASCIFSENSVKIYKYAGKATGTCAARATGQSKIFRLMFVGGGGTGPSTRFTVTT